MKTCLCSSIISLFTSCLCLCSCWEAHFNTRLLLSALVLSFKELLIKVSGCLRVSVFTNVSDLNLSVYT